MPGANTDRAGAQKLQHAFNRFVAKLDASTTTASLRDSMADVATLFGIQHIAYLALVPGRARRPNIIATYPKAWVEHYEKSRYHRLDPVIVSLAERRDPFSWEVERAVASPRLRQFYEEASFFGIRAGLTIPLYDADGPVAALTLATATGLNELPPSLFSEENVLQLMAVLLHKRARERIAGPRIVDGVRLSRREYECLEWAAAGKSATDIAVILGLAPSTVIDHLSRAKAKLGVRTIVQAVALFARTIAMQKPPQL
ncbi:MAG: LuxR family transcriptional regulator [Rhizomicrobium sp.]